LRKFVRRPGFKGLFCHGRQTLELELRFATFSPLFAGGLLSQNASAPGEDDSNNGGPTAVNAGELAV
jgi:hypothetical protein